MTPEPPEAASANVVFGVLPLAVDPVAKVERNPERRRLIPELDGVRGLAILLVMFNHSSRIEKVPRGVLETLGLGRLPEFGWIGVDLFFVLSGFLITGILLDSRAAHNYFRSFYARRVLRIFPLYVVSVLAYFHLAVPLARNHGYHLSESEGVEKWFWLHLSNWPMAFGAQVGLLGHFWSLAVEEQFYLVWPLVVFVAGARRLPLVCLALIAAGLGLRLAYAHNTYGGLFLYELTPFRVETLAFGSLAALLVRQPETRRLLQRGRTLAVLALGGIGLLVAVIVAGRSLENGAPPMATFGFTALGLIFTAFVLFAYLYSGSANWLTKALRLPVLRAFGKYSYGIYVLHVFVFVACGEALKRLHFAAGPVAWFTAVGAGFAISYAAALVSWKVLETHFLNLKSRFPVKL